MSTPTHIVDKLKRGLVIAQQIQALEAELASILGTKTAAPATAKAAKAPKAPKAAKGKHIMSPEGRARIAAAQRARWSKIKRAKAPAPAKAAKTAKVPAAKPAAKAKVKRNISPESRAKMVEGAKQRWAAIKAEADRKNSAAAGEAHAPAA